MKPLTIKELYKECSKEIKKGNGDKTIMISSDDEGNSYHYLWYSFTPMDVIEEPVKIGDEEYEYEFEFANEDIAKKEDTIILG